jgi:iron(III) transport system permease protein
VTERLFLVVATLVLVAIGLLPVAAMLKETLIADGRFSLDAYRALLASDGHFALLMGHSLGLALLTASISTLIGVPLGVLIGKADLPGRGAFALLFTAPLLMPSYVLAVAWFSILGRTGLLSKILPDTWSQTISSAFFGLFGCTLVLVTAFMPIAMLLTIAFLRTVNPRLEHAGRLVSAWPRILFRITLPLIGPAIVFAAVLIFLLSLGEIGVPMYLHFPVHPVETLTQFAAFYDFRAATVAAAPLLLVTLIVLGLQIGLHRRVLELGRRTPGGETVQIALGPWRLPVLLLVLAFAFVVCHSALSFFSRSHLRSIR